MKVLKHKIIVQNTEEPDSICIEENITSRRKTKKPSWILSFFGIATKINLIN
jgi:hypothetical protein